MDASSFLHQSDSRYCFSLGPDQVLFRLAVAKREKVDSVELIYGLPHRFGREHYFQKMEIRYDDGIYAYYETVVNFHPPRFLYIFRITAGGKRYALTEFGIEETYDYNRGFLNTFQMIGENRADYCLPKPSWVGRLVYQIFPERFASHVDPKTKPYVNRSWDSLDLRGGWNNPPSLGGDLYGIVDHLDYLKSLGVGAIYLNPIHPSPSNHKYDILDYYDVDPMFGGKEAFRLLVSEAKKRDMKVMMDLVFNHTSHLHPMFQDVLAKGKDSPYHEFYFIHGDKPDIHKLNYDTFATHFAMPKLDTNNPKVQDFLISIGEYWLREFGVDGFRLDVCEGVSHEFWTRFKMALKRIDPEVFLLGEFWMNCESFLGPNQIDGAMNYPYMSAVSDFVSGQKDAQKSAEMINNLLVRYKYGNNAMMLNLLSSHDTQRFLRFCQGDRDRSLQAYALLYFYLGLPCLYYGDEIFMDGGGDPDCRRGMEWGSPAFKSQQHATLALLGQLRRNDPVFTTGDISVKAEGGLLAISRTINGHGLVLLANNGSEPLPLRGEAILSNLVTGGVILPKGFAVVAETERKD